VDYTTKLKSTHLLKDANTGLVLSPSSEKQMMLNTNDKVFSYPTELEEAVPTQLDRKMSRSFKTAKRSTILGNANVTASLKAQEIAGRPARMDSLRRIDQHRELTDIPDNLAISTPPKSNVNHHVYIDTSMGRPRVYMSELSALQYMIVRYVAVVHIEQYVKSAFNATELLNLIETKKSSIWGKFFTGFKKPKNTKQTAKEEGTFGVPLDLLTERTGVESNLGSGHSPVKLAAFIDDAITAMRQMNMSVEGVFRKNGNIRRLKELTDAYDRNQNPDLTQENAIQVAALLKKFLRELPDPLLTYRLHSLFLCVESKFFFFFFFFFY
jgi:hypothetical protein